MRKKTLRNFLSFLLVLVCTVTGRGRPCTWSPGHRPPASPRWRKPSQRRSFPPPSPQQLVASPLVCVGAFLGMLAIVAIGLAVYRREKRCGKRARQGRRSYNPPGGHGVPRQKQSIRVFVLSYFTSEQGRQLLPALFLRRTKAAGKAPRRLVTCVLWAGKAAGQPLHILLDGQGAVHLHHGAA